MSQIVSAPSLDVLLIAGRALALFASFLVFAWAFRHWRRAAAKDAQRVFEQLDLVRSELLIMKEVMHSAAHRVDSMAQRASHETRLVAAPVAGAARGYEIAARMARNGSAKEELMKSCGVTAHEAELLIKLHGQKVASAESIGRQVKVPVQPAKAAEKPIATQPVVRPSVQQRVVVGQPAPVRTQRSRLVAVG